MIDLLKAGLVASQSEKKSFLGRLVSFFASVADGCMMSAADRR